MPTSTLGRGYTDPTPNVSPEYTAFMEDRTPENLRAWQIAISPGGKEAYDKRVQALIAEGDSLSRAEDKAWDYWGSEESRQYEYNKDLDYEIEQIKKVWGEDRMKNRWAWTGGEEPEGGKSVLKDYVDMWGWNISDPVRTSQQHANPFVTPTSTRVADMTSDILEGRTSYKTYDKVDHSLQEMPDVTKIVEQVSSVAPENRGEVFKDTKARLKGAGYGTGTNPNIENVGYEYE